MTLQRQTISIPIGVGQSEAEAAPYVEGNARVKNGRFPKRGLIGKRRSFAPRGALGMPSTANALAEVGGVPSAITSAGHRRYDAEEDEWTTTNSADPRPSQARVSSLVRGRQAATCPSVAILQDVMMVVWTDVDVGDLTLGSQPWSSVVSETVTDTRLAYAFFRVAGDELTLLSGPTIVTSGFTRAAHVVALETGDANRCFVVIGETSSSQMGWARYPLSAGTYVLPAATNFGGQRDIPNRGFDVCASRGGTARAFAVWEASGGLGARIVSVPATGSPTVLDIAAHPSAAIFHDAESGKILTASLSGSVGATDDTLAGTGTSIPATLTLPTGLSPRRCVIGRYNATQVFAAWSDARLSAAPGGISLTDPVQWGTHCEILGAGHSKGASVTQPNLLLIGKPYWSSTTSKSYIPVCGLASRRGFLVSFATEANVTSAWAPHVSFSDALITSGNALDPDDGPNWTTPLVPDSSGVLHTVYPVALEIDPFAETVLRLQLDHVRANVTRHAPVRVVKVNDLAIYGGGAGLGCIDGQVAAELTPQRPDKPFITNKPADVFFPAPGASVDTMWVSVGWGWVDGYGREHRGPISDQNGVVWNAFFAGTTTAVPYLWAAPIPMPTALLGERYKYLFLDVYCSKLNDRSQVRRVARIIDPPGDPSFPDCKVFWFETAGSSGSTTYPLNAGVLLTPDVTTARGGSFPVPYTDTELEAEAPAAVLDVVSTQQRLWALSAESRFSVLVTKPITSTYAPEFSSALSVDVPAEGGECTALAALDDKVIVFKRNRIYVIVGDPGDANGDRATIQKPRLISSDIGCVCASSVVEGPFGVAFQSARGLELLTRGLELSFIGERVQDSLVPAQRTAGVLIPEDGEVRWLVADDQDGARWSLSGDAIIWDYRDDQWAIDAVSGAAHYMVSTRGEVWRVAPFGATEVELSDWSAGAAFNLSVTTPWIQTSGVQGFQRVWRLNLLGYYYTGNLHVRIAYDYDEAVAETHTWTESVLTSLAAPNGRVLLSVRPNKQKCAAIKITIAEDAIAGQFPPYPTAGRGIEIVTLDAEVGVKSGTVRRSQGAASKR